MFEPRLMCSQELQGDVVVPKMDIASNSPEPRQAWGGADDAVLDDTSLYRSSFARNLNAPQKEAVKRALLSQDLYIIILL